MSLTTTFTLAAALQAIGNADAFTGDPFTTGGMAFLGIKEGDIDITRTQTFNDLTAPELTGDVVHQSTAMGEGVEGTIPLIVDAAGALYAKIAALGTKDGGFSSPQSVVPTALWIVPRIESVGGTLSYNGTTWVPAAPVHALMFWRVRWGQYSEKFSYQSGGKKIITVPFKAMFATNTGVPEGKKLYVRGDPVAAGVTLLRI